MDREIVGFLVIQTILQWLFIIVLAFEVRRVKNECEKYEYILRELWWELPTKEVTEEKGAEND